MKLSEVLDYYDDSSSKFYNLEYSFLVRCLKTEKEKTIKIKTTSYIAAIQFLEENLGLKFYFKFKG